MIGAFAEGKKKGWGGEEKGKENKRAGGRERKKEEGEDVERKERQNKVNDG